MNKLITILGTIVAITATQAELTTKDFVQLTKWATSRGYTYDGGSTKSGIQCFVFTNSEGMIGLVPRSSDTADEAINALIASTAVYREISEEFTETLIEVKVNGIMYGIIKTNPEILKNPAALRAICEYAFTTPGYADRAYSALIIELQKNGWLGEKAATEATGCSLYKSKRPL
jgi:hypothetical protein